MTKSRWCSGPKIWIQFVAAPDRCVVILFFQVYFDDFLHQEADEAEEYIKELSIHICICIKIEVLRWGKVVRLQ